MRVPTTAVLTLIVLLLMGFCAVGEAASDRGVRPRRVGSEVVTIPLGSGEEKSLYSESYALIVGISKYERHWPMLPGVKEDIRAVAEVLEAHGFQVTVKEDLRGNELDREIRSFIARRGRDRDNRLLFYFAGHGHTLEFGWGGDMGYFVPADAPSPHLDQIGFESTALAMQRVEEYAKRVHSNHALFVFDSCFSGSLFATRGIPHSISYKTANPVRQFITSGSANERVPDESVFRHKFVEALEGRGDLDGDGFVTGGELGQFLQDQVIDTTNAAQHPQWGTIQESHLSKGDFVFQLALAPETRDEPAPVAQSEFGTPPPHVAGNIQVLVNTVQGRVFIDGRPMGTASINAPFTRSVVSPSGIVEVRVEADGFEAETRTVQLIPGQWTQQYFQLIPETELQPPAAPPPVQRAAELDQADALVAKATDALLSDHLTTPEGKNAVAYAREALALVPAHAPAQQVLRRVVERYRALAQAALRTGELEQAERFLESARGTIEEFGIADVDLGDLDQQVANARLDREQEARRRDADAFVDQATDAFLDDRLTTPEGDNAVGYARQALALVPEHGPALKLLGRVVMRCRAKFHLALRNQELADAKGWLDTTRQILAEFPIEDADLADLERSLTEARQLAAQRAQEEALAATQEEAGGWTERATQALWRDQLTTPEDDNAVAHARRALDLVPDYQPARGILQRVVDRYQALAESALQVGNLDEAERFLTAAGAVVQEFGLAGTALAEARRQLEETRAQVASRSSRAAEVASLLEKAVAALTYDRLAAPPEDSLVTHARRILELEPENSMAKSLLTRGLERLVERTNQAIEAGDLELATDRIMHARAVAREFGIESQALGKVSAVLDTQVRDQRQRQQQLDELLGKARRAIGRYQLTTPADDNAVDHLRRARTLGADESQVRDLLGEVVDRYVQLAEKALRRGDREQAEQYAQLGQALAAEFSVTAERPAAIADELERRKREAQIAEWNRQADAALQAGRLQGPGDDHALAYATRIRALDAEHPAADAIAREVLSHLGEQVEGAVQGGDLAGAKRHLSSARALASDFGIQDPSLDALEEQIAQTERRTAEDERREQRLVALLAQVDAALRDSGLSEAVFRDAAAALNEAEALAAEDPRVQQRRSALADRQEAAKLLALALTKRQEGALEESLELIDQGLALLEDAPELVSLRAEVVAKMQAQRSERLPELLAEARRLRAAGEVEKARDVIGKALALAPSDPEVLAEEIRIDGALEAEVRIEALLSQCEGYLAMNALTTPTATSNGGTAVACYRQALELEPDNETALAGLEEIASRYVGWINNKLDRWDPSGARSLLARLETVDEDHPQIEELEQRAQEVEQSLASRARTASQAKTPPKPKPSHKPANRPPKKSTEPAKKPAVATTSPPRFDPRPPVPAPEPAPEPAKPQKDKGKKGSVLGSGFSPF